MTLIDLLIAVIIVGIVVPPWGVDNTVAVVATLIATVGVVLLYYLFRKFIFKSK